MYVMDNVNKTKGEWYILLECWNEGDGYLVDDSFLAISSSIFELQQYALKHASNKDSYKEGVTVCLPGEELDDPGDYGDRQPRYKIRALKQVHL